MPVSQKIKYVAMLCNPELGFTKSEVLARLKVKEKTFRTYLAQAKAAGFTVGMPPAEKDPAKRTLAFLRCVTHDLSVGCGIWDLERDQSPEVLAFAERLIAEAERVRKEHSAAMAALRAEHRAEMEARQPKGQEWNEALYKHIDELNLSVRSWKCLRKEDVVQLWQLVEKSEEDILKIEGLGRKSLCEVKELLAELGLSLGMNLEGFPKHANT